MDLSKLPKLSGETEPQSPATPPAHSPLSPAHLPPAPVFDTSAYRASSPTYSVAADAWVSLILGLLLVYVGRPFPQWLAATLAHKPFHTGVEWTAGPQTGEVPYFQLQGYTAWTDTAIFFFGVIFLLDGLVWALIAARGAPLRPLLWLAAILTAAAVLFNAIVCALLFSTGIMPLMSVVAVAVGGWIFFDQWRLLQTTSRLPV